MPEKNLPIIDETLALFVKVLIPALVGVSVKIAVEMGTKQMTIKRAVISIISGVGLAWLSSGLVNRFIDSDIQPLVIATVAITSEKIVEYALYKLNVDVLLGSLVDAGRTFLINFLTGKK